MTWRTLATLETDTKATPPAHLRRASILLYRLRQSRAKHFRHVVTWTGKGYRHELQMLESVADYIHSLPTSTYKR